MDHRTPPTAFAHDPADLLQDAVESLSEGLAVFDADQRLVICNGRYAEMLSEIADLIRPGVSWRALLEACLERGVYANSMKFDAASIDQLTADPAGDSLTSEIEQSNGRIYSVSYRTTKNGGFVLTRTDITERRMAEGRLSR